MLEVKDLTAAYGRSRVLEGVTLKVAQGEAVTLMGRNGMGKTTTIMSILGLKSKSGGNVQFGGRDVSDWPAHKVAAFGIGLVPEGRRIFPNLTVEENLIATARPGQWNVARVLNLFPRLGERKRNLGTQLSGGEQQMLAMGRALLTNPKLLILDEATEGLAPIICDEIWKCLHTLKQEGQAILVVDKHLDKLRRLADRHYVIQKGRVVWEGSSEKLQSEREKVETFISV
ncbi:MAG: ABC transporter ATP-binding protein [Alphaproteobacteria bacterium]|nr:ABC transporter ATP-binding protein [Alphaproteobacteria bacterium]